MRPRATSSPAPTATGSSPARPTSTSAAPPSSTTSSRASSSGWVSTAASVTNSSTPPATACSVASAWAPSTSSAATRTSPPRRLLGVEYAFQIAANQSFEFKNTFYPALDPFFAEYRNVTEANYKISLAAGDGLSLKLGVYNEYDSEAPDDSENNDFKYFGALVYDF